MVHRRRDRRRPTRRCPLAGLVRRLSRRSPRFHLDQETARRPTHEPRTAMTTHLEAHTRRLERMRRPVPTARELAMLYELAEARVHSADSLRWIFGARSGANVLKTLRH